MREEGLTMQDLASLDMDDANKIKCIVGEAGLGKSTITNDYFRLKDERYSRYTSSNVLKQAAIEKYGNYCDVNTIAGGLYNCANRGWYRPENEKPQKNHSIVLDEVPQTDKEVFNWAIRHVGEYNIVMTFDEKQMLAPESEKEMRETIETFFQRDDVQVLRIEGSWRPKGPNKERTREVYNWLYNIVDDDVIFSPRDIEHLFKVVDFHNVEYKPQNAYICKTNDNEAFLYKVWRLDCNPEAPLIKKGAIASRDNIKLTSYPVLPQSKQEALNAQSYLQVANVASCTRFQGSEVDLGNELYYIVNYDSVITARELYTVVTRVRDINDLRLVYVNRHNDDYRSKKFLGLPIKVEKTLYLNFEETLSDVKAKKARKNKEDLGYYIPEQISAGKMKQLIKMYGRELKDNEVYQARYIMDKCGQICYYVDANDFSMTDTQMQAYNSPKGRTSISAKSAISRDAKYHYTYCGKIYEILNKHNLDHMRATRPLHVNDKHANYYLDLFSAHIHVLKFCDMPIDGILSPVYDENMMNWYVYHGDYFSPESIIEDDLTKVVIDNNLGECEFLFATPKEIGSNMADRLYAKAHRSIEDKEAVSSKHVHWGYYEKPFMWIDGSTMEYATIRPQFNHELLICAIYSKLTAYMYKVRLALNSDKAIVTDACYFDELTPDTISIINSILPSGIDYRIRQKYYTEDNQPVYEEVDGKLKEYETVVYQTYDELKHKRAVDKAEERANWSDERKELERQKKRDRYAKKRAEQRRALANKDNM